MSGNDPTVQLLLTGNEIMSGDTVDSNSAMIARRLAEIGLAVHRKVTLGDDRDLLCGELDSMARASDIVIINGGLGPTVDDLTAEILAEVAGVPVERHPDAVAHLESWCAGRNLELSAANLKQALLPRGAALVPNPIGSAVGFELEVHGCRVICTPGVPGELSRMLDPILAGIRERLPQPPQRHILRLQTFGLGESSAQQLIADACPDWPVEVELGFRAGAPQMEIKLSVARDAHLPAQRACHRRLQELFGDHIIGEGDTRLAERVLELLRQRGRTLVTAESCTGGLIASMITRIAGASDCFHAGFVTYSNDIKQSVLGVEAATLAAAGAVSEPVVRQMALGALARSGADYAIAVSGVAGPGGGTEAKPVGTVWLAWGTREALHTRCLLWPVERSLFQTMIAAAGLDMIRRTLLGIDLEPRYFEQRRMR
jgi:nicotinamide-nucleotide amidase